jgi:hypothetical protein
LSEQSIFSEQYSDVLLSDVTARVGCVEDPISKHHHLRSLYQFGTPTDDALQGLIGSTSLGVLKFTTSGKIFSLQQMTSYKDYF